MGHDLLGNLLSEFGRFDEARNASSAPSRSHRCWREATTIWSGVVP